MKKIKKLKGAETDLEVEVQDIINDQTHSNGHYLRIWLQDLAQHGCISGMVSALIYYTDTIPFYIRHQEEIDDLVKELCEGSGMTPAQVFGKHWDSDDFMGNRQHNQNLLAWFGFEETARKLAERNGIEI